MSAEKIKKSKHLHLLSTIFQNSGQFILAQIVWFVRVFRRLGAQVRLGGIHLVDD